MALPKPSDVVTVRDSEPPGLYELKDGLQAGDAVRLESFDRGWWTVVRESDGQRSIIFQANIESVFRT